MDKILVTSAGCVNGVNVIKALKGHKVVACSNSRLSPGLYLTDKYYVIDCAPEDHEYLDTIYEICFREGINIIIPTHSSELGRLALDKMYFDRRGIKIALCDYDIYDLTENKVTCNAYLEDIGIKIPKMYPKEFPMVVKPIVGSGSKGVQIVNNKTELQFYNEKDTFTQEYIKGTEYTVDGISDLKGRMICALPRIRLETKGGLATKSQTVRNEVLVDLTRKIANWMGIIGAFNVQCIEKNGEYYFIDVNVRFPSGGLPLDVASGMNTPDMIIKLLNGETPKPELVYGKTMLRFWDSIII